MRYIFDFDRTLYDTDAYIRAMKTEVAESDWYTPRVWEKLESSDFVYEDSLTFLKKVGSEDVHILTAYTPELGEESFEFQKTKIERSGIGELVNEVTIMSGDKGLHIKELCDDRPTAFVDDRIDHLLSAKAHCPAIKVVQMVRPEAGILSGDPTVPVASTLVEVDAILGL